MYLPVFLVYESAKTSDCIASFDTFSKLDILELRDREKDAPSFLSEKLQQSNIIVLRNIDKKTLLSSLIVWHYLQISNHRILLFFSFFSS